VPAVIPFCYIVLPPEDWGDHQDREDVLRHEIGHCNGWPGHHPGAIGPGVIPCEQRYSIVCATSGTVVDDPWTLKAIKPNMKLD
jgi:hypothetical protein